MSEPINGPFEFGEEAPKELMGWRQDLADTAKKSCQQFFGFYDCLEAQIPPVPCPVWELEKLVNNGRLIPTFRQETGDCVAASLSQAGARLSVAEIAVLYQEELLKLWHVPYIYGISRVQVGGGQIPGPGSTGAWGAAAVKNYGVLFDDDPGVPKYSGAISDEWGEQPGPPEEFQLLAANNLVRTVAPIVDIGDLRDALCNYYPITIASNQGFRMKPMDVAGYHVFYPEGVWMHQMALIAWMDDPFQAAYRLNSWGPNAHGTPLNGEPYGGAWCLAEDLENELACESCEIFCYSKFDGFPSAADRGILSAYTDLPKNRFQNKGKNKVALTMNHKPWRSPRRTCLP